MYPGSVERTSFVEREEQKHSFMSRLFITTGRKAGITPKDIVKTIVTEAGVPFNMIGKISVKDSFTFVEISRDYAERVIKSLDKYMLKGKKIRVEKVQKKSSR